MATWATKDDLVLRYGEETINKLSTRRNWDSDSSSYISDVNPESRNAVVEAALEDAKQELLMKIGCCYDIKAFLRLEAVSSFSFIRSYHIKLTILMLKNGAGDCAACKECTDEFEKFCDCNKLCADNGECLVPEAYGSAFAVQEMPKSCLPKCICSSCEGSCCCASSQK